MVKQKKAKEDILLALLRSGGATRRELEKETGYSWGMVSTVVASLMDEGLVEEGEKQVDTGRGRNAKVLHLAESSCCIGVDFNAGGILVSVFGLDGTLLCETLTPNEGKTQEEVLATLFNAVEEAKKQVTRKVFAIGISCQGFVSAKEGVYLLYSYVPEWEPYPLAEEMEKRFNAPCYLDNDMVCLAHDARGQQAKSNDLSMLVRLGDGVGFAFVGREDIKSDRFKGDYGHMIVEKDGLPCHCGKRGCLEAYGSIRGLLRRSELPYSSRETLFEHKEEYEAYLEEASEKIALALINAISGFVVNRILLTGEMLRFGTKFVEDIQRAYDANKGRLEPDVRLEPVEGLSPTRGAASLALRKAGKRFARF